MPRPTRGATATGPLFPDISARPGSCRRWACTTGSRTGWPELPRVSLPHVFFQQPQVYQEHTTMSDNHNPLARLVGPRESLRMMDSLQRGASRRDILAMLMAGG